MKVLNNIHLNTIKIINDIYLKCAREWFWCDVHLRFLSLYKCYRFTTIDVWIGKQSQSPWCFTPGLFHRGISQSGTALCSWALSRPGLAKEKAKRVAELMDCPIYSTIKLVDCLRTKDAVDIIGTDLEFQVGLIYIILLDYAFSF